MTATGHTFKELVGIKHDAIPRDVLTSSVPLVLRGLVAEWPLVKSSQISTDAAIDYIRQFYQGEPVTVLCAQPHVNGRLFYNEDFTGFNFAPIEADLHKLLSQLAAHRSNPTPPLLYMGSTAVDSFLPGFKASNDLNTAEFKPMTNMWISNKGRIAAHADLSDNIACCVVGKRRFTLFPPEQIANLYIGPLDFSPAGRPISLVDFHNPDFEKFPKFRSALEAAQIIELEAGDAIFIPSMWWHHVESLTTFNILVNYWWRGTPLYMGTPMTTLEHALITLRSLPKSQKQIWQGLFNHYIFENTEDSDSHIPKDALGVLGDMNESLAKEFKAKLLDSLTE